MLTIRKALTVFTLILLQSTIVFGGGGNDLTWIPFRAFVSV